MKGLVLAVCLGIVFMLLFGCASPAQQGGKPMAPPEQASGTKELPVKPSTPPEGREQVPKGLPAGPAGQEPLNGSSTGNGNVDGSYVANEELPTLNPPQTIAQICGDKAVDAYCSNENDTHYQIPEADGIPRGRGYEELYLKNIYAPGDSEHPNPINCTLQFNVTFNNGTVKRYSQVYNATLGPGEIAGPYQEYYNYNDEKSAPIIKGLTVIRVCKDY